MNFFVVMEKLDRFTCTVQAQTVEEAQNFAMSIYPGRRVALVEPMVACPWCSGEGCSVYGVAKGGCTTGEVSRSRAIEMKKEQ